MQESRSSGGKHQCHLGVFKGTTLWKTIFRYLETTLRFLLVFISLALSACITTDDAKLAGGEGQVYSTGLVNQRVSGDGVNVLPINSGTIELVQKNYEEASKVIVNPDRGFYVQYGGGEKHEIPHPYHIKKPAKFNVYSDGYSSYKAQATVYRLYFPLGDFYKKPISESYLENLNDVLAKAKTSKVTVIPRFYYVWGREKGDTFVAPEKKIIKQHVSQLAKVINKHIQSISFIEMGFIGAWGEWHSDQYGDPYRNKESAFRRELVTHALEQFDDRIYIALRYPADLKKHLKSKSIHRIGLHNDCSNARIDTYPLHNADILTKQTPQGGEVCEQEPKGSFGASSNFDKFYGCDVMVEYFNTYNFDVLNGGTYAGSNARFERQGCWQQIRDRLGYRFVLTGSKYKDGWLHFSVTNKGFGKSFKSRKLSLLLEGRKIETDIDVRNWLSGESYVEKIKVGEVRVKEGTFEIEGGVVFANTTGNKVFFHP